MSRKKHSDPHGKVTKRIFVMYIYKILNENRKKTCNFTSRQRIEIFCFDFSFIRAEDTSIDSVSLFRRKSVIATNENLLF